jgi:hypothetical protein
MVMAIRSVIGSTARYGLMAVDKRKENYKPADNEVNYFFRFFFQGANISTATDRYS